MRRTETPIRSQFGWSFFLVFFAVKPLIDLMWNVNLGSLGGVYLNPPRLVGFAIFPILLVLIARDSKVPKYGASLIPLFLCIQLSTMIYSVSLGQIGIGYTINILLRGFDAFLFFMVFGRYWTSREKVFQLVMVLWLSTLLVNAISVVVFLFGGFNTTITGGIARFAGLYSDAGGPSYNGVFGIIFGALAIEMATQMRNRSFRVLYSMLFIITLFSSLILIWVAVTKSAMIMLTIFAVLWWGVYKKRTLIFIPALSAAGYYIFSRNETLQHRFVNETRVFLEGDFSTESISSLGTGRMTTWIDVLNHFSSQPIALQLLGAGRSFGAHNQFIAYLMLFGIFGLVVFVALVTVLLAGIYNKYRVAHLPEFMAAMALLIVFLANSVIGHPFLWSTSLWHLMILLSLIAVPAAKVREWKAEGMAFGGRRA